ncbi:MAG: MarR family transcriptional regulator [Chitinophagaceae bacterium]|nr:MarR family transcriptional regulator [Chitinophagaceae bacterium]
MKIEQVIQTNKFRNKVHKAGLNILYTAWWLKTATYKELKDFGLTHEQYNVLRILKGKYPQEMCVKDIGYRMIEKNSNVPRIIDRLVDKKLVKRNQGEQDGRQTVIQLTQAGLKILASSTIKINELYDNILSLNNKEAETLNNLLEKIRETEA